ncbi:MAG: BamA/TamA family outer membrane protein [Ignavibacteriae bacterium]|nr:BamA/TamA family outer membrane protein [Ignavibacteriota bacterium]
MNQFKYFLKTNNCHLEMSLPAFGGRNLMPIMVKRFLTKNMFEMTILRNPKIYLNLLFLLFFITLSPISLLAQNDYKKEYLLITPGSEYEAGALHSFIFGKHWRDVWTVPVKVEVLSLEKFAGGLTPIKRGGGFQTKSLRLKGNDGHIWKFRSMEKDPSKVLPKNLRETFIADVFQDQISSAHPMAALVVAPILEAVEILQSKPYLVYMPNDERLGEFQNEFGGLLGMMEIHPDVDEKEKIRFKDAEDVKGTLKLFNRLLDKRSEKIDANEYLKARLVDIFLGDWDRHTDQWKWALYNEDEEKLWKPIPRDRDQAFAKWDGFGPTLAEYFVPQFVHFDNTFPNVKNISWSGRFIDRRHLTEISKSKWDSITTFVQDKLTDKIIEQAVSHLPSENYSFAADELITKMKSRRNSLNEISNDYYGLINDVVDIHCSNKDDLVEITRLSNQQTEVTIVKRKKKNDIALYHKIFDNKITNEIRIYLNDGDDKAIVKGEVETSPLLRIIGGEGKDEIIDNSLVHGYFLNLTPIPDAENKTEFYDSGKKTKITNGSGTYFDDGQIAKTKTDSAKFEPLQKDRGSELWNFPLLNLNSDDGFVIGGQSIYYKYNFRDRPYDYKISLSAAYATIPNDYNLHLDTYFNSIIKNTTLNIQIQKTGLFFTKFHGYGNETTYSKNLDEEDFYMLEQELFIVAPTLFFNGLKDVKLGIGISFEFSEVDLNKALKILDYNNGRNFEENVKVFGSHLSFKSDTRDNINNAYEGFYLTLKGSFYPKALDLKNNFYSLKFDARTYFRIDALTENILAIRIGGGKNWDEYPLSKIIFLGGENSLRGFSRERFSGDAAVFAQAEMRTYLFPIKFGLPGKFGVHFFAEAGRVFVENEDSEKWHASYGGGVWMSFIDRMLNLSFDVATSKEMSNFYLRFSMPY